MRKVILLVIALHCYLNRSTHTLSACHGSGHPWSTDSYRTLKFPSPGPGTSGMWMALAIFSHLRLLPNPGLLQIYIWKEANPSKENNWRVWFVRNNVSDSPFDVCYFYRYINSPDMGVVLKVRKLLPLLLLAFLFEVWASSRWMNELYSLLFPSRRVFLNICCTNSKLMFVCSWSEVATLS